MRPRSCFWVLAAVLGWIAVGPAEAADRDTIWFTGCRVLPAWDAPVLSETTVTVAEGRFVSVRPDAEGPPPAGAAVTRCDGGLLVPGFWNAHVHLLDLVFARTGADEEQSVRLEALLTRWGVVHAVDTGSDLRAALGVSDAVRAGRVRGPELIVSGLPMVPENGRPFYAETLPMPELGSPQEAREAVRFAASTGARAIKLMTVSLTRSRPWPAMGLETVRAAVDTAHGLGLPVLAHPTSDQGLRLATDGGVDVILHTTPLGAPWDAATVVLLTASGTALTPTLALWGWEAAREGDEAAGERLTAAAVAQLAAFHAAGGEVLFGTDVGYMDDSDPSTEYRLMVRAGLSPRDIIRALTQAPARRFAPDRPLGRIAPGFEADLVLIDGDPFVDVQALARVRQTWRAGQRIYDADGGRDQP